MQHFYKVIHKIPNLSLPLNSICLHKAPQTNILKQEEIQTMLLIWKTLFVLFKMDMSYADFSNPV